MSIPSRRGPKALSEILGELFTARGYGQFRARAELEAAWAVAVGEASCRQTRLGEVRRGVLNVTVAHSALLEELSAFGKPGILAALRRGAPATTIHDIRFRVGAVEAEKVASPVEPRPKGTLPRAAKRPSGTGLTDPRKARRSERKKGQGQGGSGSGSGDMAGNPTPRTSASPAGDEDGLV